MRRARAGIRLVGGALLLLLWLSGFELRAQEVVTLISFTNVWAYEQSGLEPDPGWRSASYDDQVWPRGPGLLGFEDVPGPYLVHAPLQTRLTTSSAVTSFYFRTTFEFSGDLTGLSLTGLSLVDDGCVIYLNGTEVKRFRMPQGQNAATLATAGPVSEGTLEPFIVTNASLLRQGRNVMAVEVHQNSAASGDIMWGMKLTSLRSLPLTITREPLDLAVEEGQTAELSVEVAGGPVFYQWFRDGVAIVNATNAALKISPVTGQTGRYFVTASNSISFLRSQPAFLNVYADRSGPRLLSAVTVTALGVTNTIDLTFSETLLASSQTKDLANFSLTRLATGAAVSVTNAAVSFAAVRLRVDVSDPDWILNEPYYLTVNHVRDWHTNVIAPDSRVGLGWRETRLVQSSDASWNYHAAARFDPQVYDEPWSQADYQEGPWWAQGRGGFKGVLGGGTSCFGELLTAVGFQPEPILFRSTFVWPADLPTQAQVRFSTRAIDGLVLYVNGTEAYRFNVGPGPVGPFTRALSASAGACVTNTQVEMTNLVAGENWLAAAVVASAVSVIDEDMAFELEMHATTFRVAPLPANPPPTLEVMAVGVEEVRLSWEGAGYALETATLLGTNAASRPVGPWQEVPNMTNPYFYSVTNPPEEARFFRLRR